MSRLRRDTCIVCGGHEDDVGPLSARGKCAPCGEAAILEANRQQANRSGPVFDRWRERMAASVGASTPPHGAGAPPLTKD